MYTHLLCLLPICGWFHCLIYLACLYFSPWRSIRFIWLKLQASTPHVYVQFCSVHLLEAFTFIWFDGIFINFYSPPPCLVFTSWSFSTGCVVAHLMGSFISWSGYSEVADFINGVLFLQFQVHSQGVDPPYSEDTFFWNRCITRPSLCIEWCIWLFINLLVSIITKSLHHGSHKVDTWINHRNKLAK
jgi:hypothetical protein